MKNKEIEELLNEFKKGTHLFPEYREIILSYIEQLEKKYKELKDRNEITIDRNIEAYRIVEQLENNRDKAIEYIKMHSNALGVLDTIKNYTLLDILKGDSDYE